MDQAKRMKELERENAKLKRLVAELSLEKQILKDVAKETSKPQRRRCAVERERATFLSAARQW